MDESTSAIVVAVISGIIAVISGLISVWVAVIQSKTSKQVKSLELGASLATAIDKDVLDALLKIEEDLKSVHHNPSLIQVIDEYENVGYCDSHIRDLLKDSEITYPIKESKTKVVSLVGDVINALNFANSESDPDRKAQVVEPRLVAGLEGLRRQVNDDLSRKRAKLQEKK